MSLEVLKVSLEKTVNRWIREQGIPKKQFQIEIDIGHDAFLITSRESPKPKRLSAFIEDIPDKELAIDTAKRLKYEIGDCLYKTVTVEYLFLMNENDLVKIFGTQGFELIEVELMNQGFHAIYHH